VRAYESVGENGFKIEPLEKPKILKHPGLKPYVPVRIPPASSMDKSNVSGFSPHSNYSIVDDLI
jgi:hypothetical protein